jgi:hypothetical protein
MAPTLPLDVKVLERRFGEQFRPCLVKLPRPDLTASDLGSPGSEKAAFGAAFQGTGAAETGAVTCVPVVCQLRSKPPGSGKLELHQSPGNLLIPVHLADLLGTRCISAKMPKKEFLISRLQVRFLPRSPSFSVSYGQSATLFCGPRCAVMAKRLGSRWR